MNLSEKISIWEKVYKLFHDAAIPSKTVLYKGFFEYWIGDTVGVPLWFGNPEDYNHSRPEADIEKYYGGLAWGRIYCSDRFEFIKVITDLNKKLVGLPVKLDHSDSWSWQHVWYKDKKINVAKKTYSLMFYLSGKPYAEERLDLSYLCLSKHPLAEIGDVFSILDASKIGRIGSYKWRPYGLEIGAYSGNGKNRSLELKSELKSFFAGDEYFDRVALTFIPKKTEKDRQTYLAHVIFSDVKDLFDKNIVEFTLMKPKTPKVEIDLEYSI